MITGKYTTILIIITAGLFTACKKQYIPVIEDGANSFLVVSGFINTTENSKTTIVLSHTTNLGDTVVFAPEAGSVAKIISNTGESFPLTSIGNGVYESNILSLNNANKYRLSIVREGNRKYESEFVDCRNTQPIDSLNWKQEDGDVTMYVNTHDASGSTRYYWWDYTETWQYETPNQTPWKLEGNRILVRSFDEQVHICWVYGESPDILLGNTSLLTDDVVSQQPLLKLRNKDKRLNFRYSMLVRQYGITAEAHKYWINIKNNSQQLGTLFDQQPSQLKGNITAVNNPDEPVLGFVSAAKQQVKRIFIQHDELDNWQFDGFEGYNCAFNYILVNPADPFLFEYSDPSYVPWYFVTGGPLYIINKSCIDCTLKGGTNVRPSFW
jgi:Domain of unknown function (DUF4249)